MWQLTNLITRKIELDFSDPDEGKTVVSQLYDGNIQLINAVELVNWESSELQFIVCEGCGIVRCQPQNWVEIKRSGSLVLITPAFTLIDESSGRMKDEYLPPHYLLKKGVIYIEQANYTNVLCEIAAFPDIDTIATLTAWEASKIFQLEAPYQILGILQSPPKFLPDIVLASSEGNFMEQTIYLETLVNNLFSSHHPVELRQITESDQIISFYLDVAGIPEWKALSYDGYQYSLYLEPGYVIS